MHLIFFKLVKMSINKFTSIKCTFIHSYAAWKLHTATPPFADSGPRNQTTDVYRPHRKLFVRFTSAPLNKCLLLDRVHSITAADHIYKNSKNLSVIIRQAEVQPSSGLLSHESATCFLCRSEVHSCFCLSVFISSLSSFGLMRLAWCFWVSVLPSAQNVTDYPLHLLRHRYAHLQLALLSGRWRFDSFSPNLAHFNYFSSMLEPHNFIGPAEIHMRFSGLKNIFKLC